MGKCDKIVFRSGARTQLCRIDTNISLLHDTCATAVQASRPCTKPRSVKTVDEIKYNDVFNFSVSFK